jgi:hypothetical protein
MASGQRNRIGAGNTSVHGAPRNARTAHRALTATAVEPVGDPDRSVVNPWMGAPHQLALTRRRQDQVWARICPHRSRHSSPTRAPWPNLPPGDQDHPHRPLAGTAPDLQTPASPAASSLRRVLDRRTGRQLARLGPRTLRTETPHRAGQHRIGRQAQKAGPGPRDSPHPCRTYGVARPAERLDSTALSRRSLIRMRPLVQVQPGPLHPGLSCGRARRLPPSITAAAVSQLRTAVQERIPALLTASPRLAGWRPWERSRLRGWRQYRRIGGALTPRMGG